LLFRFGSSRFGRVSCSLSDAVLARSAFNATLLGCMRATTLFGSKSGTKSSSSNACIKGVFEEDSVGVSDVVLETFSDDMAERVFLNGAFGQNVVVIE
jgi:hypothetical protein